MLAVVACAVASLAGGVGWAALARYTGWQLGGAAVGIGLLGGGAALLLANRGSAALGAAAGLCAAAGVVVGKLLLGTWVMPAQLIEDYVVTSDDSDRTTQVVAWDLARQGGDTEVADWMVGVTARQMQAWGSAEAGGSVPSMRGKEWSPPQALAGRREKFYEQAAQRVEQNQVTPGNLRALGRDYAQEVLRRVGTLDRLKAMSSLWDLLWLTLTVGAAYKLVSGGGGSAMERKPWRRPAKAAERPTQSASPPVAAGAGNSRLISAMR